MRKVATIAIGIMCLGQSGVSHAAVTWGSWFLDTKAYTSVSSGGSSQSDTQVVHDADLPTPVTLDRSAESQLAVGQGIANSKMDAHLAFQDHQTLTLDTASMWSLSGTDGDRAIARPSARLDYGFTTTQSYAYLLAYDVAWDFPWSQGGSLVDLYGPSGLLFYKTIGLKGVGSLSGIIGPGSYYLQLIDVANTEVMFGSTSQLSGAGAAHFTFSLTAIPGSVPEPASWAMMIGGFALAGGALRGRARGVPAASGRITEKWE